MALLTFKSVSLHIGADVLLDHAEFTLDRAERVCLIGRNGVGKSTFLRLLASEILPDDGEIQRRDGLKISKLNQDVPVADDADVYSVVAAGLGELGPTLSQYHQLLTDPNPDLELLGELQHNIETADGWQFEQRIGEMITRLELPADKCMGQLSGGWRRRVLLAQALVCKPDVLLLDEPTNHLDIAAIEWLEQFLRGYDGTVVFISHDRAFLQRLATRIVDLDRGILTSWPGTYEDYLRRKQAALEAEAKADAEFDKKLAKEETWIRQGIKARRTRNEGRVRALKALREEHAQRRKHVGKAKLNLGTAERSGKLVFEVTDLHKAYSGQSFVADFSTTVLRGDRIGLVGPNGIGKSTLLKLLLEQIEPDSGNVKVGTKLEPAYFDQQRNVLDPNQTPVQWLGDGKDMLEVHGQPKHVMSYLQDFLFAPARARSKISVLSGGERNRLLLARIFMQPSNLLVLDEPTNDLDMETLELLEEQLSQYQGTILIVSHDRAFLDAVVTSCWLFAGNGRIEQYIGGYSDLERQRPAAKQTPTASKAAPTTTATPASNSTASTSANKLSYKDKRELDALPEKIAKLEAQQEALQQQCADPGFYQQEQTLVAKVTDELAMLEQELEHAYQRWEALEG